MLLCAGGAAAFDGSLSAELSYGNRTFSANVIGDWGMVPERLYLVATYGVVRYAPDPDFRSQATHLFGVGLDWLPSVHWMTSLNASFSPKSTDFETFGRHLLTHTRRSAQGLVAAGYQSAGFRDLEWGVDASAGVSWHELVSKAEGPLVNLDATTSLVAFRPALGATLIIVDDNEVGLRGSYTWYSQDPTTAGGFPQLRNNPSFETIQFLANQAGVTGAFFSAPVWFDARVSYLRRFGARVTGRLAYTYIQYVPGKGNAHAVSTRWSWKVAGWARFWVGATVQYDAPAVGLSGYGTLGAELATE